MQIRVVQGNISSIEVDALVVHLFEGAKEPAGPAAVVDAALGGAVRRLIQDGEAEGKAGELSLLHTLGRMPAGKVVVAGLGKEADLTADRVRQSMAESLRLLRRKGARKVAAAVPGEQGRNAQAAAEGAVLGLYTFDKYKKEPRPAGGAIEELLLVDGEESRAVAMSQAAARGMAIAESVCLARDLINEPGNALTPTDLADRARQVAAESGLECTIMGREQMQELGMGALLGVAQGSQQPPRFIVLRYVGDDPSRPHLGLLGKGITFDSGGISIKPAENMGNMKGDMAGAATVIAAMRAIARLKPRLNVTALAPATENLPSGTALKPGDVLKSMSGKTIEIISTDAEGRLVLADALGYAHKLGLTPLVDVATLTGAIRVALGEICVGAFTNNQELMERVLKAAAEAGEKVWQLPMFSEYKEQNKSDIADIKNTGGAPAGSITAAQFLAEFAGDTPWVHLDIAGTSLTDKEKGYNIKGATGITVRTLINVALSLARQ